MITSRLGLQLRSYVICCMCSSLSRLHNDENKQAVLSASTFIVQTEALGEHSRVTHGHDARETLMLRITHGSDADGTSIMLSP